MPKISILVITYNQENFISRALDSILIQKDYVFEIIISDDCSTDNNWEIITRYSRQYPDLIKPIRNEKNLGIFGNIESLYDKPTGDVVFWLSGDDTFCDGLFEKTIQFIHENRIDLKKDYFSIYFDFKVVYPNKFRSFLFRNSIIKSKIDVVRLKHRNLISNRASCYSVSILRKFNPVRKDIGIFADALVDIQQMIYSEKSFYCPFIGSIYYAGIGISKKVNEKERLKSLIKAISVIQSTFNLNRKDYIWYTYIKLKAEFFLNPSKRLFIATIKHYFLSIDLIFGLQGFKVLDVSKFILKSLVYH